MAKEDDKVAKEKKSVKELIKDLQKSEKSESKIETSTKAEKVPEDPLAQKPVPSKSEESNVLLESKSEAEQEEGETAD